MQGQITEAFPLLKYLYVHINKAKVCDIEKCSI